MYVFSISIWWKLKLFTIMSSPAADVSTPPPPSSLLSLLLVEVGFPVQEQPELPQLGEAGVRTAERVF